MTKICVAFEILLIAAIISLAVAKLPKIKSHDVTGDPSTFYSFGNSSSEGNCSFVKIRRKREAVCTETR